MLSIGKINMMSCEELFRDVIATVLPRGAHIKIAFPVALCRPFKNLLHLYDSICNILDALSREDKIGLLRCHSQLADREAELGLLSAMSEKEEAMAGLQLDQLHISDKNRIQQANRAYMIKFGFPFVICSRQNTKANIIRKQVKRLNNTTDQELEAGLEETKKICLLRLKDIITQEIIKAKC